jgi:uncharacterized membrane protein
VPYTERAPGGQIGVWHCLAATRATCSGDADSAKLVRRIRSAAMSEAAKAAVGTCAISGRHVALRHLVPLSSLRPSLAEFVRGKHPGLDEHALIERSAINDLRGAYVRELLEDEVGAVTRLEEEVIQSLREHEIVSTREDSEPDRRTAGERLADAIATWGGSWAFIVFFGAFMAVWIGINAIVLSRDAFDPYPFILLNLLLSTLAALQAPIILMSQNRKEARDRHRAELDYKVNLKAELEIRHLHEKLDHLLQQNGKRLLEIQEVQIDLLRELSQRGAKSPPAA